MRDSVTGSDFPPHVLREYAVLADGERGAVVGPRGDIVWMCAPRWHHDAVFSALLGGPGRFVVEPIGADYVWGGSYADGSMIWRSRWVTTSGIIESHEALAMPATPESATILRRIRVRAGDGRVRVLLEAWPQFGERHASFHRDGPCWHAESGGLHFRLTGLEDASERGGDLICELRPERGRAYDVVLEISGAPLIAGPPRAEELWAATERAWDSGSRTLDETIAPRDARQAHAVLRGLTSSDGGMVAAATLGLPERSEGGRNYDYRFAWVRDQCFAGQAAATVDAFGLLDAATTFVAERLLEDGPLLRPAYTVAGKPVPDERRLPFPGYPGGGSIAGNHAGRQLQLDTFGESLLLFADAAGKDRISSTHWRAAETAAGVVADRWRERDAGIWELDDADWTHSNLICAAGLKAIAAHAPRPERSAWLDLSDQILRETARVAVAPSGRWMRASDDPRVDSSLLLPVLRGLLPADDPRSRATLAAVRTELSQDGYVYRFHDSERPLGEEEGAFVLSGFHTALAEHLAGDDVEGVRLFERARSAAGPPGLFTEEFDVTQRQLRGNLPQAFVHAALMEASSRLAGAPGAESD